jgi:hypothetical protein
MGVGDFLRRGLSAYFRGGEFVNRRIAGPALSLLTRMPGPAGQIAKALQPFQRATLRVNEYLSDRFNPDVQANKRRRLPNRDEIVQGFRGGLEAGKAFKQIAEMT